ncbi:uncharacterized protein sytl2a isoform X2 [Betta splendens]|uniref:Synaptotagmin-like protein 2 n=1 Tax=Betta splendens TaxID=158456 RepID=A0A6P7PME3_BETSP|nr:uncharacterized protein sytl2a isoform X2 [Betta splendens]
MIDLSYLTEEEQETIMAVLKRDALLKKAEERRVQNLQTTVRDRSQLKYLTGDWFYEIKQLRHQDRIHGSDIIMASLRHTHKPLTIRELSHILPEKSRFISSDNKDVFVPPVLRGFLEEPPSCASDERYQNQTCYENTQEVAVQQRKNPFDSQLHASPRSKKHLSEALYRGRDWTQTMGRGFSDNCHLEPVSPPLLGLVSAEELGNLPSLETEAEEAKATHEPDGDSIYQENLPDVSLSFGSAGFSNAVQKRPELLSGFSRESFKSPAVQSKPTTELHIFKLNKTSDKLELYQKTSVSVDTSVSVRGEAPHPDMIGAKTLQLAALENTPLKDTLTTVQKIIFTGEEAKQEDLAKAPKEPSFGPHMYVEVITSRSPEPTPQHEDTLSIDLLKEDVTYRASRVAICEETDDSLPGTSIEPQVLEPHEYVCNPPLASSPVPVPLPCQSTSSPQRARPSKVSHLKHFWEKDHAGPRVIVARAKEASHPLALGVEISPQCDLKRERPEKEEETYPHASKSSGALKSLKVTDKSFVNPDMLQPKRPNSTGDVLATIFQQQTIECLGHITRSKAQNDEVRRSPSKTCHPRILPTESSSHKMSREECSPLKTFPIDISLQTKETKDQEEKPTSLPRRSSLTRELKQTVVMDNMSSHHLPLHSPLNTQQWSSSSSELPSKEPLQKLETLTEHFIPWNIEHYLKPQEKAHFPLFQQDSTANAEADAIHRPQKAFRDVGNLSDISNEWSLPTVSSGGVHRKLSISSPDTTRASSLSWESSDSYVGSSNPTLPAFSSKNMSSSKCLQRLTTECVLNAGEECTKNEKTLSVDGASSTASLFNAKHTNSSLSVPVLQQDGIEIDFTSEDNLGWRRNTGSSMSNLSLSSGMASNSSNEQVSGSIGSIYTPDSGDVEAQGSIQFAVNYIQKQGEFHMFVVHCRDLAVADTKRNRSDPYVKCYLIPDKTKLGKRKTTIKKKTLNPTYNEILTFNISMEVLKTLNLNISVWHNDTFGRNSFLGEMDLDLSEWDFDNTQINEYTLKNRVSTQTLTLSPSHLLDRKGQMRVALRFLTQMSHCERTSIETGEVQIWVKDGKNLPSDRGVTIDPFVKCTVLPDTSRKSRQKTRVVKRTANPMFNHTMVYNGFRPEDLREVCVELTVWDHDRLNNHYLGGMRLGLGTGKSYGVDVAWMDSTTNEAHLWQRMLQSGGEWVEDVLPLRMFVIAKSISK